MRKPDPNSGNSRFYPLPPVLSKRPPPSRRRPQGFLLEIPAILARRDGFDFLTHVVHAWIREEFRQKPAVVWSQRTPPLPSPPAHAKRRHRPCRRLAELQQDVPARRIRIAEMMVRQRRRQLLQKFAKRRRRKRSRRDQCPPVLIRRSVLPEGRLAVLDAQQPLRRGGRRPAPAGRT